MGGRKVYARDVGSRDGLILNVANGTLGNANTSFTYFNWSREGYRFGSLFYIIQATTLTIEATSIGDPNPTGQTRAGTATTTSGGGTVLTDSTLTATFPTDTDLVAIQIRILQDDTTPANVGQTRLVTVYVGATGAMTLSSALPGPITSGVTKYQLEDNPSEWGRLVSDPTSTAWQDATTLLTGGATITATGMGLIDTDIEVDRFRIRRLTTNATNALNLRIMRGR